MEIKTNNTHIYYFKIDDKIEDKNKCFSHISELNTNSNNIITIKSSSNQIISVTSENDLIQWEYNKEKDKYIPFEEKPYFIFPKIKFKSISLSKSVTIGLNINGNVLVWGQSSEGLLGLGFDISKVENPTILEDLKNIIQISSSDHHAVAINKEGAAYSWGTGKYGELGLERSIYSSVPQQIISDTCYSKIFCSNLISCFLDFEGHFHYFGVVIKQLGGNGSTLTIKSLLADQIYHDGKALFLEKQVEELENEKFKNIMIGNGFITLLSFNGGIFILEYNDKLTKLYTKYNLDGISLVEGDIFGLSKEEKNNVNNCYLLKWKPFYNTENDLFSDSWHTTIWKFKDINNTLGNYKLVESNLNINYIFLKLISSKENKDNKEELLQFSENYNIEKSLNLESAQNQKFNNIIKDIKLEYENEFDDSYNLKYKRNQLNAYTQDISVNIINNPNNIYNSFYALGKNNSIPFNYNQNINKTVLFQNKVMNSPLVMNNSRNIYERNGIYSSNKNNTIRSNFIYSSNGEFFSKNNNSNKNDINDNVNIYEGDISRSNIVNSKSNQIRKNRNTSEENNNYNSEENEFIKKELDKYRNDVDNIINNFNQKKQSKSFSVLGKNKKRGNSNLNNIYTIDKYKENNSSYDNSNNDLIKGFSITKSISNQIHNNENQVSINNDKNKNIKKSLNKKETFGSYIDNEQYDQDNENINRKSRNKDRMSPKSKRIFKDKRLKNMVEHLSLIEEESEPTMSVLKIKRRLSFSKVSKKQNLRNNIINVKNLKKKIYNINKNKENKEENKSEEDLEEPNKNNYSDLDLAKINLINNKNEYLPNNEMEENDISENDNYNNKGIKTKTRKEKDKKADSNINRSNEYIESEEDIFYDMEYKKIRGKNNVNCGENDCKENYNINNNFKISKTKSKGITNNDNLIINGKEDQLKGENEYVNQTNNKKIKRNNKINNNKLKKNAEEDSSEDDTQNDDKKKTRKEKIIKDNNNFNKQYNDEFENDKEKKKRKKKRVNNGINNLNYESEEEIEEEYMDKEGNIIKKKKINNKNYNNDKGNYLNNEKVGYKNLENINNENKNRKINMRLKNQSRENDIYNDNNISPKKSIKFKNTFGKNINENNNNAEDKNPFKNSFSPKKITHNETDIEYNEEDEENDDEESQEYYESSNIKQTMKKKRKKGKKEDKMNSNKKLAINNKEKIEDNSYNSNEEELYNLNNNKIDNQKKNKKMIKFKKDYIMYNNSNDNAKKIMMYFVYLIQYYMKKKIFSLYAKKIANYQKYLEKKCALKILYRILKKRIIFYKIKFFHRYKKIYKYLCKNNIVTITQIYSEESSSSYFFSENNNNINNKIIPNKNKNGNKNNLKENIKIQNKIYLANSNKIINNKEKKEKNKNIKKLK